MENVKIILDTGIETNVNGIFYVFNSKYYFIYTQGEIEKNDYVKLYVVQVCKEIKNTLNGPVDTGCMIGLEISDSENWKKVQESITKIVEDKKNRTQSPFIQYLSVNMLVNLKIVSKNKFKLMKYIVEDNFNVVLTSENISGNNDLNNSLENSTEVDVSEVNLVAENNVMTETNLYNNVQNDILSNHNSQDVENTSNVFNRDEVIIDYRTRFFEEQQKNEELQTEIKILNEKLNNIKGIIG